MINKYIYDSPVGKLYLQANDTHLLAVRFTDNKNNTATIALNQILDQTITELQEYFAGCRKVFNIPLAPQGTQFQQRIWQLLQTIPYGETRSYQEIAKLYHNPLACRAVGHANNQNHIAIIIPCHRVIGANGKLVGYGAGLDLKEKLLHLESRNC